MVLAMWLAAGCSWGAEPVLVPVPSGSLVEAWVAQLDAAGPYHGTFRRVVVIEGHDARYEGVISSDPARRRLHVTTELVGVPGYRPRLELVVDGVRAWLQGRDGDAAPAPPSVALLPPVDDPLAPFGPLPNRDARFPFGGDLRTALLDCLRGATLSPGTTPGAWRVHPPERVADVLIARHDPWVLLAEGSTQPALTRRCDGLEVLAGPSGALEGFREADGATTTMTLYRGASDRAFVIPEAALVGAVDQTAALAAQRAEVDAALADPARVERLRELVSAP